MKKLYFATGNINKLEELKSHLKPLNISIEHIKIDYPEIRSDSIEDIAKQGAKYISHITKKTSIVDDSGLFIHSLNGFPGTYTKWVHFKIGHEGLLKLLEGKTKDATFKTSIGLCKPDSEPISFLGEIKGKITEPKGTGGWGHDPIFIPENSTKTWAEDMTQKQKDSHRIRAANKLYEWLKRQ